MVRKIVSAFSGGLKNFYFISSLIFLLWLSFFDTNDLFTQAKLSLKKSELNTTIEYYTEEIEKIKIDREALLTNEALLEQIAREKYLMKKPSEDIFIVEE